MLKDNYYYLIDRKVYVPYIIKDLDFLKDLIMNKLENKEDEVYIRINIKDSHDLIRKRVEELGLSMKKVSEMSGVHEDYTEWFSEGVALDICDALKILETLKLDIRDDFTYIMRYRINDTLSKGIVLN